MFNAIHVVPALLATLFLTPCPATPEVGEPFHEFGFP